MGQDRKSREGLYIALGLASALFLAGCDQKKPAPDAATGTPTTVSASQPPTVAALNPNRPPTDDEMLSALLGYWKVRGTPASMYSPAPYFALATPVGATQSDDAITRDILGTRIRTVTVNFTFRANWNLTYVCPNRMDFVIYANADPSPPELTYPNRASAGSTFTCPIKVEAERVEEGWNVQPIGDNYGLKYLFKR